MGWMIFYLMIFASAILLSQAILRTVYRRSLLLTNRINTYIGQTKNEIENENAAIPIESRLSYQKITEFNVKFKEKLAKKITAEAKGDLERKLRDAGISYRWSAVDFRFLQILIAGGLLLLCFLLFGRASEKTSSFILMSLAFAGLGYYYPLFYLSSRKKRRMIIIQKTLADFFDMINLSVEAGLGLDAAILRVCKNNKGPLSKEFLRAIDDMKLGKSRREAFIQLRNRVPVDAFQSIMTSLIQADQLGIGMSKVLRTLTERIREHQRQLAREKAMKAPVKMMFPMVLFIFPALFIVLLGPLIIYLLKGGLSIGG